MRAVTNLSFQSTSFSADTIASRAFSLSAGATESSRSRQTTSASPAAAFSNSAGREPGTKSFERYSRAGTRRVTSLRPKFLLPLVSSTVFQPSRQVNRPVHPRLNAEVEEFAQRTQKKGQPQRPQRRTKTTARLRARYSFALLRALG